MSQKKFVSYNALKKQLQRRNVKEYGASASFLLKWVTDPEGNPISSQAAVAGKACLEGDFSAWRDHLEKLGYLTCSTQKFENGKERWIYSPGPALRPMAIREINREKLKNDVVATMSDIDSVKAELHDLRDQFDNWVGVMIDRFDPPDSAMKRAKYKKDPDGLLRMSVRTRGRC